MDDKKKKSFMKKIFKLKGRVPDKGVKEGKKSIAEIIGMKRKEKKSKY
jgi:hypothetical protein